ncbi:hypothetical protein GCM10009414_29890 [Tatumella terrea]
MKKAIKVVLVILFFVSFFVFLISVANEKVDADVNQLSIYLPLTYLFVFPIFMFWDKRRKK